MKYDKTAGKKHRFHGTLCSVWCCALWPNGCFSLVCLKDSDVISNICRSAMSTLKRTSCLLALFPNTLVPCLSNYTVILWNI